MARPFSVLATASLVLLSIGAQAGAAEATSSPASDFIAQQGGEQWRASKLAGVTIYGPDSQKVGDVTDVLLTRDGTASAVVIGVGGFLGIGEKNVAIPFNRVTFSQEPKMQVSGVPADSDPIPTGLGTPAQTNTFSTGALPLPNPTPRDATAPVARSTA